MRKDICICSILLTSIGISYCMGYFFAEVNFLVFCPKTMDYNYSYQDLHENPPREDAAFLTKYNVYISVGIM